jgi:hypothetical protein
MRPNFCFAREPGVPLLSYHLFINLTAAGFQATSEPDVYFHPVAFRASLWQLRYL